MSAKKKTEAAEFEPVESQLWAVPTASGPVVVHMSTVCFVREGADDLGSPTAILVMSGGVVTALCDVRELYGDWDAILETAPEQTAQGVVPKVPKVAAPKRAPADGAAGLGQAAAAAQRPRPGRGDLSAEETAALTATAAAVAKGAAKLRTGGNAMSGITSASEAANGAARAAKGMKPRPKASQELPPALAKLPAVGAADVEAAQ